MAAGNKLKMRIVLLLVFSVKLVGIINADDTQKELSEYGAYYEHKIYDCAVSETGFTEIGNVRITIINPRGEEKSNIRLSENKYEELKSVKIIIYDKDGKEILKKNKKDMIKYCGFGGNAVYNDICVFDYDVDVPGYPYTIEYEYEIKSSSLFFLRGKTYQHRIPVNYFKYAISIPGNGVIRYKTYGSELEPIPGQDESGMFAYIWEKKDISAYDDIDYVPAGYGPGGRIVITPNRFKLEKYEYNGDDWRSIGSWYANLSRDKYSKKESEFRRPVQTVTIETIKQIYDEITGDIRYVSISTGIGGWQPHDAVLTEKNAYGDCKDMSTLLISRLREKDIEAYPALVLTRDDGVTDVDFPNFGFNHVITVAIVGNDTLWMDPTCRLCPFGELPYQDEDINVLVVTNDGGELWRTPASLAENNKTLRTTRINIEIDLSATLSTNISSVGSSARYVRDYILSADADETRRYIQNMFPGGEKKFRVKNFEFKNLEDISKPLEIIIEARTAKKLDKIGKNIYCPALIFSRLIDYEKVDLKDRKYPINLFYPAIAEDSIFIIWENIFDVESISAPLADSVSFPFGGFRMSSVSDDYQILVNFEKTRDAYMIMPDEFENFSIYHDKLKDIYEQYVKLQLK
ncbi:MAG: DUF3857 domain-containing protein [Candidatus Zixiibacteriota bacterium]